MIRPERFEGNEKVPGRFILTRNDSVEMSLIFDTVERKKKRD